MMLDIQEGEKTHLQKKCCSLCRCVFDTCMDLNSPTHQPSSPSTVSAQWANLYLMCIKMRQDPLTLALVTLLSKHTPVDREEIQVLPLGGPCRQRTDSGNLHPPSILTRWTLCSGSRRWADAGTSTWTCARWPGGSCASRPPAAFL